MYWFIVHLGRYGIFDDNVLLTSPKLFIDHEKFSISLFSDGNRKAFLFSKNKSGNTLSCCYKNTFKTDLPNVRQQVFAFDSIPNEAHHEARS